MSPRDVTVLVVGATMVGLAGTFAALLLRATTMSRWVSQVAGGLVCGAIAAVVAAVPYVDVVPDAEEGLVWPVVGAVLVLLALGVGILALVRRGEGTGRGAPTRRGADQETPALRARRWLSEIPRAPRRRSPPTRRPPRSRRRPDAGDPPAPGRRPPAAGAQDPNSVRRPDELGVVARRTQSGP